MKKYTKLITLIATVIFILMCMVAYKTNKEDEETLKYSNDFKKVVNEIISSKTENLNEKDREVLKLDIESKLVNSYNKEEISQGNFILGYLNVLEKENKVAIEKFNESIKNFPYVKNSDMKIKCYYELSRMYLYENNYKESEKAYRSLKQIAVEENKKDVLVEFSFQRSYDIYHTPGGKKKCVEIMEESMDIAKEIDYKNMEDVYFRLGQAYWYADRIVEGINSKLEALNIAQGKNLKEKISLISTDIGVDYLYSKNYKESIIYLSRVLTYNLDDKYKDAEAKSYALLNLTEAYIKEKDYTEAQKSIKLLEQYIYKQKDSSIKEDYITYAYANKADLENDLGDGYEALKLLNIAKSRYGESNNFSFFDFTVKLAEEYGDAYYSIGNYEKALKYHKEVEKLVKEREITYLEQDANEKLYLDYKALGDTENTIKYLEKNNELRKELDGDKDRQYSQYLISEFENEVNRKEISKLQEYKDTMGLIFIILCVITMIITTFTYMIFKKNREICRLNKLFKSLSVTDSLTKLHNRRALDEYLTDNWQLYQESCMPISFVMIDIDFFKKFNDNYGHIEGDKALERVASEIRKSCRNSDFLARYGGEEFIIIMSETDRDKCMNIVNKIKSDIYNLNIKHEYSGVSDRITLSIGVTTAYVASQRNYIEYIKKADEALYEAKERGRNLYVYVS